MRFFSFDDYEGWYLDNFGNTEVRYLVKTFKFADFNRAADFMRLVSDYCRISITTRSGETFSIM